MDIISEHLSALCIGVGVGTGLTLLLHRFRLGSYKDLAKSILHKAESDAVTLQQQASLGLKEKEMELQRDFDKAWQKERDRLRREEERLQEREDKIDTRMSLLDEKLNAVQSREAKFKQQQEKLAKLRQKVQVERETLTKDLEKISGLTRNEAREELLQRSKADVEEDAARLTRRIIKEAEDNADREATKIICQSINRLAVSCSSDITVSTLSLPNDEMKGRIIGREGRNIRAIEQATGVNIIIDDTPSTVVISGMDPLRKHVAKVALSELVMDGRIHPTRIEEVVDRVQKRVEQDTINAGEEAALQIGAMGLHSEIIKLVGAMKFRHSYGQNLLAHSLEVSYLLGMMAAELGLDQKLGRRIGLLHDMGKVVAHEREGTHAVIGHDIALKYGESEAVANGIGCHHNEMDPITVEGSLCGAADALSAARPGARVEAVESYVQRLSQMEKIAKAFPGVEQCYALQAGREIRVVVQPDAIDDAGTLNLARDIAKRMEAQLKYPGKIKVTIIREKRAIHYAV